MWTIETQKLELYSIKQKDDQIAILQDQLHEVQKHLKELATRKWSGLIQMDKE